MVGYLCVAQGAFESNKTLTSLKLFNWHCMDALLLPYNTGIWTMYIVYTVLSSTSNLSGIGRTAGRQKNAPKRDANSINITRKPHPHHFILLVAVRGAGAERPSTTTHKHNASKCNKRWEWIVTLFPSLVDPLSHFHIPLFVSIQIIWEDSIC